MSAPVVTSALYKAAYLAKAFSYSITGTNTPTSYGATGLPSGLSVNTSTGVISGTPVGPLGQFSVTISATNGSGTGTASLLINVVTLPLEFKAVRFPRNYTPPSPRQFFRDFLGRLRGGVAYGGQRVVGGQVVGGALLGTTADKNYNAGPWVDTNRVFRSWDVSRGGYAPIPLAVGDQNFVLKSKTQALTADRTVYFQDKGLAVLDTPKERVALLSDVLIPRNALLLPTTVSMGVYYLTIDPTLYEVAYGQLHQNTTVIFTVGVPDGKTITIGLINDGTAFTVTWPAGIKWSGTHTQPPSGAGGSGIGIYSIMSINGTLYGLMQNSSPALPTMMATVVIPPKNYGGGGGSGPPDQTFILYHLP